MSNTVDNRVVEMRFDNKDFESGVSTSIDSLEKLSFELNELIKKEARRPVRPIRTFQNLRTY